MKIIGLCGYAQVGKDTACSVIRLLHPEWKRYAFADALKYDIHQLPGVPNSPSKEALRPLYVEYGKLGRTGDADYWVHRLWNRFGTVDPGPIIITDVRYLNEVRRILTSGGKVVRIVRAGYGPANDEEARSFEEIEKTYSLPKVLNDSTPEELGLKVWKESGY